MMRPVQIAELKARLSRYLRQVRAGAEVVVTDRDRPVAKLVPYTDPAVPRLGVRKASRALHSTRLPPPLRGSKEDIVQLLMEERGER